MTGSYEWLITVFQSVITGPIICPFGFDLPQPLWSTLNRFILVMVDVQPTVAAAGIKRLGDSEPLCNL